MIAIACLRDCANAIHLRSICGLIARPCKYQEEFIELISSF